MIEPGPLVWKSDTLPRRYKRLLVQQVLIYLALLHITPPFLDSSSNLSLSFNEPVYTCYVPDTDVLRGHLMGFLRWAPIVTGEKILNTFVPTGDRTRATRLEVRHSTT